MALRVFVYFHSDGTSLMADINSHKRGLNTFLGHTHQIRRALIKYCSTIVEFVRFFFDVMVTRLQVQSAEHKIFACKSINAENDE